MPGQASEDRQVAGRGVGARVGYEGAFWERTSCWQSLAPCLALAGMAALTGWLQSPEKQRDEAACAWEDVRSGQGVTPPPPQRLGAEGRAALTTVSLCSELVSAELPLGLLWLFQEVLGRTNVLLSLFIKTEIRNTFSSTQSNNHSNLEHFAPLLSGTP